MSRYYNAGLDGFSQETQDALKEIRASTMSASAELSLDGQRQTGAIVGGAGVSAGLYAGAMSLGIGSSSMLAGWASLAGAIGVSTGGLGLIVMAAAASVVAVGAGIYSYWDDIGEFFGWNDEEKAREKVAKESYVNVVEGLNQSAEAAKISRQIAREDVEHNKRVLQLKHRLEGREQQNVINRLRSEQASARETISKTRADMRIAVRQYGNDVRYINSSYHNMTKELMNKRNTNYAFLKMSADSKETAKMFRDQAIQRSGVSSVSGSLRSQAVLSESDRMNRVMEQSIEANAKVFEVVDKLQKEKQAIEQKFGFTKLEALSKVSSIDSARAAKGIDRLFKLSSTESKLDGRMNSLDSLIAKSLFTITSNTNRADAITNSLRLKDALFKEAMFRQNQLLSRSLEKINRAEYIDRDTIIDKYRDWALKLEVQEEGIPSAFSVFGRQALKGGIDIGTDAASSYINQLGKESERLELEEALFNYEQDISLRQRPATIFDYDGARFGDIS